MKLIGRQGLAFVATAAAMLALAGCAGAPGGSPSAAGPVNIAYLDYSSGPFTDAVVAGLTNVVGKDGGKVTAYNANFDPQTQLSQCSDVITSGRFQAIVVGPANSVASVPCAQQAHAAGIPVAAIQKSIGPTPYLLTSQVEGVVATATTPLRSQVEADTQLLKTACEGKNPCVVIGEVASANDSWTNDLYNALSSELAPDIQFVQAITTGYDPAQIVRALPDALTAHPDVDVYFSPSDDSALVAQQVLAERGFTDVEVIGLGGSKGGVEAVKAGTILGTTANWPIQYGELLGTALVQTLRGEEPTDTEIDFLKVDSPAVITKDTVDQFTPEW